jgi:ArsR family transcriptional regulator, cadmium/lead-responsive transcriptional repressor
VLRGGELTAGEVARAAHLTPSSASRHLACLKDCGLLESRQDWRRVVYRLASSSTAGLLDEADRLLMEVADSMASCTRPEMTARLANRA